MLNSLTKTRARPPHALSLAHMFMCVTYHVANNGVMYAESELLQCTDGPVALHANMALRTHPTSRLKGGWRHCREVQRRRKLDDARVRLRLKSLSVNRLARSQGLLQKLF